MRSARTTQAGRGGVMALTIAVVLTALALPAGAQTSGTSTATEGSVSSGGAHASGGSVSSGEATATRGSTASGDATATNGSVASGCSTASNDSTASGGCRTTVTTIGTTPTTARPGTTPGPARTAAASPTSGRLAVTGPIQDRLVQGATAALILGLLLVLLGRDGSARGARQTNSTQA